MSSLTTPKVSRWSRLFLGLSSSLLIFGIQGLIHPAPGSAAETLKLKYGFFEPTLPVQDLRTYAETGKASPKLRLFLGLAGPQRQPLILTSLRRSVSVEPNRLAQMLETQRAQAALAGAAEATLRPGPSGVQDLRSGLLQGATAADGLSLISFLEAYPRETIAIDVRKASELAQENQAVLQDLKALETSPTPPKASQPTPTIKQPNLFQRSSN